MLIIYPDTNALHHSSHHSRKNISNLTALAEDGVVEVRLSPVVVAEIDRQHSEERDRASEALATAVKNADLLTPHLDFADLNRHAEAIGRAVRFDFVSPLTEMLKQRGCKIEPYPEVTAEQLVQRELKRLRPTGLSNKQSTGLRDQVIWDGCRALLRKLDVSDRVVFVSKDRNAFLNHDGTIHPHLVAELSERDAARLQIVESIAEAINEAKAYTARITGLELELGVRLLEHVREFEGRAWNEYLGDINSAQLPGHLVDAWVSGIDFAGVSILSPAASYSEGHVTGEVEADVVINGRTTSAALIEELRLLGQATVTTDGRDDPVYEVSVRTRIYLAAELEFDPQVTDPQLVEPTIGSVEIFWDDPVTPLLLAEEETM